MDTLTSQGIEAFRNGEIAQARTLFQQAAQANPRNEDALLWLSQLAETDDERAGYLRRVLDINPGNATARRGLEVIEGRPIAAPKGRAPAKAKTEPRRSRRGRRAGLTLGQRLIGLALGHLRATIALIGVALAIIAILIVVNSANRPIARVAAPAPTLIPLSNLIAYVSDRSGAPELYVARADGTGNPRRLTTDDSAESDPAWSPDGELLAVKVAIAGDRADLYIIDPDRSERTRLATGIAIDQPVSWSPDGERVAYVAETGGNFDIFAQPVRGDASSRVNLSRSPARDLQPQWSPDGARIAFVSDRDGAPAIFVANANGSNPERLFDDESAQSEPAWSPDGRHIAHASNCRGDVAVSLVKADGSAQARVAWVDAPVTSIAWSPDGGALLVQSGEQTFLAALDSRRPARLSDEAAVNASWSPDGRSILFAARGGSQFDIVIADADASSRTLFRADPRQESWPAWQPEEDREPIATKAPALTFGPIQACLPRDRIVFVAERDGNVDLYALREGSAEPQRLTSNPAVERAPAWSPDRRRIVFASNRNGDFDLFSMRADGTDVQQLTSDNSDEDAPAWSPDGQLIAFQSNRAGSFDIYTLRADGSGLKRVTQAEGDETDPAWSPDGRQIAYAASGDVFRVNVDGTHALNLTRSPAEDSAPAWSPGGEQIAFASMASGARGPAILAVALDGSPPKPLVDEPGSANPAWSPDGRRVAYVYAVEPGEMSRVFVFDLKLGRHSVLLDGGGFGRLAWSPPRFDPALTVAAIPSPTATPTITPTPSRTPTRTATVTPSRTPTRTAIPTLTATRTPTHTPSRTPTVSRTPIRTPGTATRRPTSTLLPSRTPTRAP